MIRKPEDSILAGVLSQTGGLGRYKSKKGKYASSMQF